jgi:hypothetical protein
VTELGPILSAEAFDEIAWPIIRPPFASKFGALPWSDRHKPHSTKHEWLIKNILTRGEQAMLVGASQSGKSFLAIDLALAIARGVPWFGNRTRQGLVIYQAGESAKGVRDKRIPAYERHHGLWNDTSLPFVLLTLPIDLYSSDADADALIEECRHWQAVYPDFRLELLTIDTFSAATPGADENGSKDVSGIRRRCKKIELALGCTVLLVHHKNAAGTKARGHTSMFADVENVLDVSLVEHDEGKVKVPLKDANGRKVREILVAKLKDGEDGKRFRFVLPAVKLGMDEDGDDITSCVIEEPDMGALEREAPGERPNAAKKLPAQMYNYLMSVRDAIAEHGESPPPGLPLPSSVKVVRKDRVIDLFAARAFDEADDPEKKKTALRQARKRCGEALLARRLIGSHDPYLWLTDAGERATGKKKERTDAETPPVTGSGSNVTDEGPGWD